MSSSPLFVLLLTVASFVAAYPAAINNVDALIKQAREDGMNLVGQVGNKVYFESSNVTFEETSWMGGQGICLSAGLQYASFVNYEEYRFVYNNLPGDRNLWVGGSVKGWTGYPTTRQTFAWEDGSDIAEELSFHHFSSQWLCLYFSRSDHIYTDYCLSGRHRTLCQAIIQ